VVVISVVTLHFSVCRQFTFVILFSTFLLTCVNYDVLFKEGKYSASQKVTIADAIYPVDTWTSRYCYISSYLPFSADIFSCVNTPPEIHIQLIVLKNLNVSNCYLLYV